MTITPDTIRAVVKRLTGNNVQGAVKRNILEGVNIYSCIHQGFEYCCYDQDRQWTVSEVRKGHIQRIWTETTSPETKIIETFAQFALQEAFGAVHLTFQHQVTECHRKREVMRNTFSSSLGLVVVHTRKVGTNTDTVVQVPCKQWIGRYLWKSETSAVVLTPRMLNKLPF